MLSAIHQNYYAQLCKLDDKEIRNREIEAVRAGLGGGFAHNSTLKVMKFKETINGQDRDNGKKKSKINTSKW